MKHAKGKNVPWLRVLLSAALALCALCLAAPLMGCKDYDDSATLEKLKEVKQNKDEATRKQDSTLQKDPAQQDPAQQDPAQQDPAQQDPAKQDPAKQDPAQQDPAKQDPAQQDPAKQDPAQQDPTADHTLSCEEEGTVTISGLQSVNGVSVSNDGDAIDLQTLLNVEALLRLDGALSCVSISDFSIRDGVAYLGETALVSGESYHCVGDGVILGSGTAFVNDDTSMLAGKTYQAAGSGETSTLQMECNKTLPEVIPAAGKDTQDCVEGCD